LPTFPAVVATLKSIKEGTDRPRAIEATGIFHGITNFKFIICLVVYKKVFGVTARLSDLLQAKSIDLGNAAVAIQAVMDSFEKMRSDLDWTLLWEESLALFNHVCGNVEQPRSRRQRQPPFNLSNSVINETIGTSLFRSDLSCENFRNDLYHPTLDNILEEMKTRFADINLSLMKSIDSLHPHSQHFLQIDLLESLQYNVPCDGLKE
jgi:hypothetical protein